MKKLCLGCLPLCVLCFVSVFVSVDCQSCSPDALVMLALRDGLNHSSSLGWDDSDPCKWSRHISWSVGKRITRIQIGNLGLTGSLPSSLNSLTELEVFEVQKNQLSGPLPSFAGLKSLQRILLNDNCFSSIPPNFFDGLSSLEQVFLDHNPFSPWSIPDGVRSSSKLDNFSATSANIIGTIPDFLGGDTMPNLGTLHLAFNNLEGGLPASFAGSPIESLWLNGQGSSSKLNGTVSVLQNMTHLTQVWLHGNSFSGPLPDFSGLTKLQWLSLRDNQLTGPVPPSLVKHPSLQMVNLTKNLLQGPTPKFPPWVAVDISEGNNFCLSDPGESCDERVNTMLLIAQSVGYPSEFSEHWKGNDPCKWSEIRCDNANIVAINFQKMGLTGTISPYFSNITSLQTLDLSDNNFTGTIPAELANLPNLTKLDVSNNQLHGKISFRSSVIFKTDGNPDWGKDIVVTPSPEKPPSGRIPGSSLGTNTLDNKSSTKTNVGLVIGGVSVVFVVGIGIFCIYRSKQLRLGRIKQHPNGVVVHPSKSGLVQDVSKISLADFGVSGGLISEHYSGLSRKGSNIRMGDSGSTLIPIHVLRCLTNNFSEANVLGRGGFGTVYRGVLHDGTKIAVKRMESGVVGDKALAEFNTEFKALLSVRHRHLVALVGYCLDENERLLVFEYMSQGTLTSHLFNWKEESLKPLDWKKRVTIALDVARGVEYLHSLAHQSFIHRDLKPSNILLGDDMRAKVADFGLVRSFPEGQASIATKLAGTFGYLAPEYAATGRVTTKVDVYSFGVILMELITGRKALDKSLNEECLVSWFRRMYNKKETFREAIDSMIDPDEETLTSISTMAKLAGHCCAREPCQRPEMSHAVNVLSSLADCWNPSELDSEDYCITKSAMNLPEAVQWWQDLEGNKFPMDTVPSSNTGSSNFTKSRNV